MATAIPSSESSEAKELSLIGKVELRIALADSDSKLESLLKTYLAPLLLKLASEHVNVRNKVSCASALSVETINIRSRKSITLILYRSSLYASTSILESRHRKIISFTS